MAMVPGTVIVTFFLHSVPTYVYVLTVVLCSAVGTAGVSYLHHFRQVPNLSIVQQDIINEIGTYRQCSGSVTFWNGSGSSDPYL
jgi:hypothetical protein